MRRARRSAIARPEIGVLAIRGPMVFDGYLDRPPELQPFFADGWLDTGDLGRTTPTASSG